MPQDIPYDVIIIGTGAGGGTLAYALARSGKRILLLERGDWLPREKQNWDTHSVFVEERYKAEETWTTPDGMQFRPLMHYYVGGQTKMFGAVLLRFRREDFGEIRHIDGISPAWPISYEDLEPYYTRAEHLYHAHGDRGTDPTEPPASAQYLYPPIRHEPRIQQVFDDLRRVGRQPFPLPVGVILNEERRELSPCIKCDTCDGYPCLVNAKADAQVVAVQPALRHPNVRLLTRAHVTRLETDPSGREVTKVIVERDGVTEAYSGDIVVLSAGAVNSAVILLRSANDKHPNGLANSSGVVGRHFMMHNNSALLAISHQPNHTNFEKTIGLNDFYFGADDWEYPLGHIQMLGKTKGDMIRAEAARMAPDRDPDDIARHAVDFWLTTEDLPDPNNRITLNRDGGIVLQYRETNIEAHQRLIDKLKGLLGPIGCEDRLNPCSMYFGKKIPIAGVAHQNGTVRFGHDPQTSALDVNCKAHDLDNLYVVDGSFFVSSSSVNPSLTIIANALRVADHLLERLGTSTAVSVGT